MGSRLMGQANPKRLILAIGLLLVGGGVLAWSLAKSGQDPAVPTATAPAGAHPSILDESEVAAAKGH